MAGPGRAVLSLWSLRVEPAACIINVLAPSTSLTCVFSSSASPRSGNISPSSADWTKATHSQFSLQPSYFSPLYAAYKDAVERDTRRQLAIRLLRAHYELASRAEGMDEAQLEATTRHRIREMERLRKEVRALSPRSNVSRCSSMHTALGYYSLLEEASAGGSDDAEAFHAVAEGHESTWKHWKEAFMQRYADTPNLPPLAEIYRRSSSSSSSSMGAHAAGEHVHGGASTAPGGDMPGGNMPSGTTAKPGRKPVGMGGKPRWSAPGVSRAVGMRKTSVADVRVAPGSGRILINDRPYDEALGSVSVRLHVIKPLLMTGSLGRFDVVAKTHGGGVSSQAHAVQHGLAKALSLQLGQGSLAASKLKGMVLYDARRVERKKPGRRKARTGFAYVRR